MILKIIPVLLLTSSLISLTSSKVRNLCATQQTCGDCLSFHENCSWCTLANSDIKLKCNTMENLLLDGCNETYIEKSRPTTIEIVKDVPFKDISVDDSENAVQMRPQHVKIKLRKGDIHNLKINLRPSKNYPLDIYFLMDASYSMMDDFETIGKLGEKLMQLLENLTPYFRVGFGSFADKPTMPWSQIDPKHLENPCMSVDVKNCHKLYDFMHTLRLTNDTSRFFDAIQNSKFTANLDNVDAGLDALMQVVTCTNHIGWTNTSRKLILVASDSLLHFAGDGKLAGIVTPNDGQCHLNEFGHYSGALDLDYPSLSQIQSRLYGEKINVIFAVTNSMTPTYQQLKELIPDFTYVVELKEDSSNILSLIQLGYEQIVSNLNLKDNSTAPISFKYSSNCGENTAIKETSKCSKTRIGVEYEFNVGISIDECPVDKVWVVLCRGSGANMTTAAIMNYRIVIEESNFGDESVIVDLEILCGCKCEDQSLSMNSSFCNNGGDDVCGQCLCYENRFGKNCECDSSNYNERLQSQCLKDSTSSKCSDRGECICGKCDCDLGAAGEFCECDSCDLIDGFECSGNGECQCGTCECYEGFEGKNCECVTNPATCLAPGSTVLCNGYGECECGRCICNKDFYGNYCETLGIKCSDFEDLVINCGKSDAEKAIVNYGEYCGSVVKTEEMGEFLKGVTLETPRTSCYFRQISPSSNDTCDYTFTIYTVKDSKVAQAVKIIVDEPICGGQWTQFARMASTYSKTGLLVILYTVVMGVVIIAAYKVHLIHQDRMEYSKFVKSQMLEKHEMNPLYKDPIRRYDVPELRKSGNLYK